MKIEKRNNVIFDLLSINNNNIDTKCAIDYIDELINFLYDKRFDNNGEWFEYERTFLDSDEIIQTEINHNEEVFCLYLSYIQRRYILLEMFNEIGKSFADTLIPVEELRNIPNLYKFDPHPEMKGYTTLIKHGILKSFPYENACGLIDDLESHIVKYVNDYFKSDDFKDVHDKHYPEILSWLNSESDNNVMDDLNNSCLDIKDEYTEKGFGETKLKKREQSTKA